MSAYDERDSKTSEQQHGDGSADDSGSREDEPGIGAVIRNQDHIVEAVSSLDKESIARTILAYSTARKRFESPRRMLVRNYHATLGKPPRSITAYFEAWIVESDLYAYNLRRASKRWDRAYYYLGVPAILLAALSGASGLASVGGRLLAASTALLAAALTSMVTFFNSEARRDSCRRLSAEWSEFGDNVRSAWLKVHQGEMVDTAQVDALRVNLGRERARLLREEMRK